MFRSLSIAYPCQNCSVDTAFGRNEVATNVLKLLKESAAHVLLTGGGELRRHGSIISQAKTPLGRSSAQ